MNSSWIRFNAITRKYDGFIGEELVATQFTHLETLEKLAKYIKGQK